MVPDPTYLETVLTCEGDFYAPNFSNYFLLLQRQLARLIADDRSTLIVKKVEPWNSVRVTLKIPPEAANRLRELAIEQTAMLRNLGILAVHIEGDNVISMSLKGRDERESLLSNIQNNTNGVCPNFNRSLSTVLLTGNKNENPPSSPSPSPSEMDVLEKASNASGEQLSIGLNSQKTCPRKSSSLAGRKRQHESQGSVVTDEDSLLQMSACSVNQLNHRVLNADNMHASTAADLSMSGGALPNGYHLCLPGQSFQSNGKCLPVVRPKDFKAGISNMDDLTKLNGCLSFCKLPAPITSLANSSFTAGLSTESSMSVSLVCQSSTTSSHNLEAASHLAKCDRINHSPSNPMIPSSCTDTTVCTKSKGYRKDTGRASKSVNLGTASDNSQIHSKQRLHRIINPYSGEFELVPEDENLVTKDYCKITESSKMPYESFSLESHKNMLYEPAIKTSVADSNAFSDNSMSSTAAALTDDSVLQAIVAQLRQPLAASRDQDENRILSDSNAFASGRLSNLAENWSQMVTNLPVHAKSHLPINSNAILIASDALQGALGGLVMNASLVPTQVTLPVHVSGVDSSVSSTSCSTAVDNSRMSVRYCTRQSKASQPCISMPVLASGTAALGFCSGQRPIFQGSDSSPAGLDELVKCCSSLVSSSEHKPVESVLPSVQQVDTVMNPLWVPSVHCLARPEFLGHFVGQNYASNKMAAGFSMASASPFLPGIRTSASNGTGGVGTMKNQCVAIVPEDKVLQKDGVRASTGKQSKSRKQLKTSTAVHSHGIAIYSENLPHGKQSKPPTVAELLANRTRQAAACLVPAQVTSSNFSVLPSFAACPVRASSISMSNIALLNLMPYQQSSADVWCSTTSSFPMSSNSSSDIVGTSSATDSTKTVLTEVGFESDLSVTRTHSDAQLSSAFPSKQNGRPDDSMAIGSTSTDFNGKGAETETEKSASSDLLTIESSSSNVSYSSALNISEVGDVGRKEQSS